MEKYYSQLSAAIMVIWIILLLFGYLKGWYFAFSVITLLIIGSYIQNKLND